MYKVVSEGKIVAYTDNPPYVKVVNGYSEPCNIKEAQGIVAGGNCYNLVGQNVFPDRPTAWVHIVDGWEILFDNDGKITITEGNVTDLQNATCELDESLDEVMEALCDIDERIGD